MRFIPKLRAEAKLEIQSSLVNAALKVLENSTHFPFQTCLHCDNFDEPTEQCKLFKAKPPARVIAFGCDKFDDKDFIPF